MKFIPKTAWSLFCTKCEHRIWIKRKPKQIPSENGYPNSFRVATDCLCGNEVMILVPHIDIGTPYCRGDSAEEREEYRKKYLKDYKARKKAQE